MDKLVQLSDKEILQCKQFAKDRLEGSKAMYQRRNNANIEKIELDILTGAMGEIAIYKFFKELGYKISKPDFAIYSKKEKSWAADMCIGDINIHCKTQSANSAKLYGNSIILQFSRGQDKLFTNRTDKDYLAWATVQLDGSVKIEGVFSIPFIFDNDLIKEPKLKWLEGIKKALYLDQFKEFELFQLP